MDREYTLCTGSMAPDKMSRVVIIVREESQMKVRPNRRWNPTAKCQKTAVDTHLRKTPLLNWLQALLQIRVAAFGVRYRTVIDAPSAPTQRKPNTKLSN